MKRSRQLTLKQCHEILRLDKNAGLEELKSAYRKRAFELHPDLNPGNPNASHDFQLLNEAYVALSAVLKPAEEARQKAEESRRKAQESRDERRRAEERARDAAESRRAREERERIIREQAEKRRAEEQARARREEQARRQQTQQARQQQAAQDEKEGQAADADATRDFQQSGYAEQDVLRDLLNDPFARRVFEDIYSELNRQEREKPQTEAHPQETAAADVPPAAEPRESAQGKPRERIRKEDAQEVTVTWSDKKPGISLRKGVAGAVKGWLRQQIDEEQEFTLPASNLVPGRRIRLRIRRGFSNDLVTVEITLPPDFVPGKPVRLRGLGKRVGPWQGDLYLKLNSQ